MSEQPMTPKERRVQLARDMCNAMTEPGMTKEERLHSMEIWLHMFEDTVTSDLILQTQIDALTTQLAQTVKALEEIRDMGLVDALGPRGDRMKAIAREALSLAKEVER